MSLTVRHARLDDLNDLLRLCEEKTYYESIMITPDKLREYAMDYLREHFPNLGQNPDTRFLIAVDGERPVGFAVLLVHTIESMTRELQTVLFSYAAPSYEILAPLIEEARRITVEVGDLYLVMHLLEAAKKEQIWLYRLGFRPELNRTMRHIPPGHQGPASPEFRIRPAVNNDLMFIIRVNAVYAGTYRPTGRDTDLQIVRATFLYAYSGLNLAEKGWHFRVLEELATQELAGYIILIEQVVPMSDQLGYYNYDVAVAPEFGGRGLSLFLCGAAETLVGAAGGGYLFGDSSPKNLAAQNGAKHLGYPVDSKRWGLDCRVKTGSLAIGQL